MRAVMLSADLSFAVSDYCLWYRARAANAQNKNGRGYLRARL